MKNDVEQMIKRLAFSDCSAFRDVLVRMYESQRPLRQALESISHKKEKQYYRFLRRFRRHHLLIEAHDENWLVGFGEVESLSDLGRDVAAGVLARKKEIRQWEDQRQRDQEAQKRRMSDAARPKTDREMLIDISARLARLESKLN